MKKMYTYLATMIIALATFTSCDRVGWDSRDAWDNQDARTLDGTWTGYIDVYYADRWGWTGDSYRTSIRFVQENAYGGWGEEADYDAYYDEVAYSEFEWTVVNGVIHIRYAAPWNPIRIYEYRLYSNYFEGYMDDYTRKDIYFQLGYDGNYNWNRWYRRSAPTRADGTTDGIYHMGGAKGTNYFATGKFAEKLKSDAEKEMKAE